MAAWNADLPVTAVDTAARTFTAEIDDPDQIIMQPPDLADRITVTIHMQDGAPLPQVGQTLLARTRITA